jgi:hypothetical protein
MLAKLVMFAVVYVVAPIIFASAFLGVQPWELFR